MSLRGKTQYEIAEIVGVTRWTVYHDLVEIHNSWIEKCVQAAQHQMAVEIAKIDHVEAELWQAWERSCQSREVSGAEKRQRPGSADASKSFVRKEMRDGNPKFMDGIMRCVEMRCKLFGLLRPVPPEDTDQNAAVAAGASARAQWYTVLGNSLDSHPEAKAALGELIRMQAEAIDGTARVAKPAEIAAPTPPAPPAEPTSPTPTPEA